MRAAWWWIDRWRKSTAYTDLTLEEQGAYRNLLDELWLRGGVLPKDERILANICGDATAWRRVRKAVLARFVLTAEGYRNLTHDQIARESRRRSEKQARYRQRRSNSSGNCGGNAVGNRMSNGRSNVGHHADGNTVGNRAGHVTRSPDQSQSPISGSVSASVSGEIEGYVVDQGGRGGKRGGPCGDDPPEDAEELAHTRPALEEPDPDPVRQRFDLIQELYRQMTHRALPGGNFHQALELANRYTEDELRQAFEETSAKANSPCWQYVVAVLTRSRASPENGAPMVSPQLRRNLEALRQAREIIERNMGETGEGKTQ